MKKRILNVILVAMVLTMLFGTVFASAFESYDTYTYSIDGLPLLGPTAYTANVTVDSVSMNLLSEHNGGKALMNASDVTSDYQGNLYIADRGNNRIVILNKYYSYKDSISGYVDENGQQQTLAGPRGVFVTDPTVSTDGKCEIYVCDTDNSRVVVFDRDTMTYRRTITKPDSALLTDSAFQPTAIAVDLYGRIFIVSPSCYEGVIVMSNEGDFTGFIGAQKVSYNLLQMIWRRFQTKEQRAASSKNISIAYNNITVDDDGFVYVTNNNIDQAKQYASIRSKSATYSPVKKLNSAGNEIMRRNGFFDPGGEVVKNALLVSKIIDVAAGAEGSWSILDSSRSRIFTYDSHGNLLFAFGDVGDQLGNGESFVSMAYQVIDGVHYLILLDNSTSGYKITVFSPTEYCDTIMSALHNENEHNYSDSITYWQDVLTRNNNFDLAYIGIGKALYSQGKYEEAQEYLSKAYETSYYSKAFSESRKNFLSKWLLPIIILIVVALVFLFKFLAWAKVKNKAVSLKVGRKSYGEELLYCFHLQFHPFDGFWDLKHEKRGSVRGGITILAFTIIAFFYQSIGKGYIFNPRGTYSTIFIQAASVLVPVLLWIVSNWCFTTLFDGEGSFKDIFVATTYSLFPLPFLIILSTILTNVLTSSEGSIVSLLVSIGYIWVGLLLFFGMLVTHDYSMGKNVVACLCSIIAMIVIMFVSILFSSLVVKMVTFVVSIVNEIANRV